MNVEKNQTPKYHLRQQVTKLLSCNWICNSKKSFHDYKTVEIMQDGKKIWNWFLLIHEALYSNSIPLKVQCFRKPTVHHEPTRFLAQYCTGYTLLKIIGLVYLLCRCTYAILTSSQRKTTFDLSSQQRPTKRPEVTKGEKPAALHETTCDEMPSWFTILCPGGGDLLNYSYKSHIFKGSVTIIRSL
jgi:hypothetical protein